MNSVLIVALPVFAIIAAGILSGRLNVMSAADAQTLNKFVFRIAMPIALFGLTASAAAPGAEDVTAAASYTIAAAIVIVGAYFFSRRLFSLSSQEAGAHAFASILGNAVFLGLPIALTIEGWARPFIVLMLIEGVFVIAIGAALLAAPDEKKIGVANRLFGYLFGAAKNPLVAGMVLGFVYSAAGLPFSGPAETFFSTFGRAAGPTALFSLGLFLGTHQFPAVKSVAGRVASVIIAKMAVLPVLTLAIAAALGLDDPTYRAALALFVCVPTGAVTFVFASQHKVYETETAAAVSVSTVLSVATISAVLIFFT